MWSLSDRGLYWVSTTTSVMSELTQFDRVKSMIRYLPPKGTAGLARFWDRIESRSPSPPARITAIVVFTPGALPSWGVRVCRSMLARPPVKPGLVGFSGLLGPPVFRPPVCRQAGAVMDVPPLVP